MQIKIKNLLAKPERVNRQHLVNVKSLLYIVSLAVLMHNF